MQDDQGGGANPGRYSWNRPRAASVNYGSARAASLSIDPHKLISSLLCDLPAAKPAKRALRFMF
jgi:hypothetical protein